MSSLLSVVEGWSRHKGGVWTAESKARGELLYGRAWCDTESRHTGPRCSSCKLLPSAPADKPRGCWARPLHLPVCWSHLYLVLWGFLFQIFCFLIIIVIITSSKEVMFCLSFVCLSDMLLPCFLWPYLYIIITFFRLTSTKLCEN